MNKNKQYKALRVGIFIVSLLYAVYLFNNEAKKFDQNYRKVKGIITDVFVVPHTEGEQYVAFIEYTDSGKIKETKAFYDLSADIKENDSVEVYIPANRPDKAREENKYVIMLERPASLFICTYCFSMCVLSFSLRYKKKV